MHPLQTGLLLVFTITTLVISIKGFYQSAQEKNALGDTPALFWLGIFVWGDATVVGPFWTLAALSSLLLQDWVLFLLLVSTFWLVRSGGEILYWFLQQFSTIERNPPKKKCVDSPCFTMILFGLCINCFGNV